jgi:hypothetical protein
VEGTNLGHCVFARVDFGHGRVPDVDAFHFALSKDGPRDRLRQWKHIVNHCVSSVSVILENFNF